MLLCKIIKTSRQVLCPIKQPEGNEQKSSLILLKTGSIIHLASDASAAEPYDLGLRTANFQRTNELN